MNLKNYIKTSKDRSSPKLENNLNIQTIFSKKSSNKSESSINVFNHIDKFSYAALKPKSYSERKSNYQEIFYVVDGKGHISANSKDYFIGKDYAFIVPPEFRFSLVNDFKNSLELLIIAEQSSEKSSNKILVKDANKLPFDKYTPPLHWCHRVKTIFNYEKDHMSKVHFVSLVYVNPKKLPEPHAHFTGHDEVWHALEGESFMAFRDNLILHKPGTSIFIPDNGTTYHSSINLSRKPAKFFFFMHHKSLDNKILITGSKGTIGSIITPYLRNKGYQFITELDINNPKNPVDLLNDKIDSYFKNINTIIHLAANSNPFIDKKEADRNFEITKKIIEASKKSGSIERIINASSINVYPYMEMFENEEKITDKTYLSPNNRFGGGQYGQAKIKSEKLLEDFCEKKKINLINLRLGCVTKNDLLPKQEDGSIAEVDKFIYLKHKELKKTIDKSLNLKGIQNFIGVSHHNKLISKEINFPLID